MADRGARIAIEHTSDKDFLTAATVIKIVMAEQITHDVVKEAQSMGGPSPIDDNATSTSTHAGDGATPSAPPTANSKPSDTTSTNATSTDGTSAGKTQTSDKAASDAVAVSKGVEMWYNMRDILTSMGRHPRQTQLRPRKQRLPQLKPREHRSMAIPASTLRQRTHLHTMPSEKPAVGRIRTSAGQAAWTQGRNGQDTCDRTQW